MTDEMNWVAADAEAEDVFGRIEVVPEIMLAIAERNTLNTKGVAKLADVPASMARRHSRRLRTASILLTMQEAQNAQAASISYDIFVILDANVNIMETSRKLQAAVIEGIDRMIGLPVDAVNIHVEDVVYPHENT